MLLVLVILQFGKSKFVRVGFVLKFFPSVQNELLNCFIRIYNQIHIQIENVAKIRQVLVETSLKELPLSSSDIVKSRYKHGIRILLVCLSVR